MDDEPYYFISKHYNPQHLSNIFMEVKNAIRYLFNTIGSIYQRNKIQFDIESYFNSVMRLITPFEWSQGIQPETLKFDYERQSQLKLEIDEFRKAKFKSLILKEKQVELYNWILNEVKLGNPVTRRKIKAKGKELAEGNNSFRSSDGWCDSFLNRYPLIRKIVTREKIADRNKPGKIFVMSKLNEFSFYQNPKESRSSLNLNLNKQPRMPIMISNKNSVEEGSSISRIFRPQQNNILQLKQKDTLAHRSKIEEHEQDEQPEVLSYESELADGSNSQNMEQIDQSNTEGIHNNSRIPQPKSALGSTAHKVKYEFAEDT